MPPTLPSAPTWPASSTSQAQVEALLARERSRGIAARRIVLAGFSQGGAIALHTGLRHAERLAAIVALSTYLVRPGDLVAEASAANRDVPIFMAHGTVDPVVRLEWGDASRRALAAAGYKVEWHTYGMPHSVVPEEIGAIDAFLARVLTPACNAARIVNGYASTHHGTSLISVRRGSR